MARRRTPFLTQAQARAVVRFQPEVDALVALLTQQHDIFRRSVAAARGAADYAATTINRSRPELKRVYHVNGLNPKQALADPQLPGPGALDFAAASQYETQAAQQRWAQSRADALADLQAQKIASAQGRQYATQQARATYLENVGSINDRLVQLAGQRGAYITDQLGTLEQQAFDQALRRRQQNLTRRGQTLSHLDRRASLDETRRHNQAIERGAGAFKPATAAAHGAASDAILYAQRQAKVLYAAGRSRYEVANLLVSGRAHQKVLDREAYVQAKREHPDWPDAQQRAVATVDIPAIRAVPAILAGAALDLIEQGHLSRRRVKGLHARGLSVRKLGLPTSRSKRLDTYTH